MLQQYNKGHPGNPDWTSRSDILRLQSGAIHFISSDLLGFESDEESVAIRPIRRCVGDFVDFT